MVAEGPLLLHVLADDFGQGQFYIRHLVVLEAHEDIEELLLEQLLVLHQLLTHD